MNDRLANVIKHGHKVMWMSIIIVMSNTAKQRKTNETMLSLRRIQ